MGMVFGRIPVETPKYELIQSANGYEVRKYPSSVIAEITYNPADFKSEKEAGFQVLASFIGVFGKPENSRPEKIAMTAPVITKTTPSSEKIAMTAPVMSNTTGEMVTMGFILPSKYCKVEDVPKPKDERVVIREEGEKKYGVVTFSGTAGDKVVEEKVNKLKECLERDGFQVVGEFVLARFNPPWITLPPFRTNEVMVPVA